MPPLTKFKRLDLRPMLKRDCEPFPEVIKRVEGLRPDHGLIVVAPFLPSPLIEKLASEGYGSKVEPLQGSSWIVYFWRET
jgi:hypothetical protein